MTLDITFPEHGQATQGFLAVTTLFLIVLVYKQFQRRGKNLPKGPPSLPFIGSIPFLGKDILKGLEHMRQKYGDIFTVSLPKPTVILNSHAIIKQAFVKQGQEFLRRPQDFIVARDVTNGFGVGSTSGDLWTTQRKFSHRVLRDFGMGKNLLEVRIQDEIQNLFEVLQRHENQPYNPMWDLVIAVSNVIAAISYSKHHDYEDAEFRKFVKNVSEDVWTMMGPASNLALFPWLRIVPGDMFGKETFKQTVASMYNFVRGYVKEHLATFNPNEIRDFIDAFILEMKKDEAAGHTNTTFHEEQLIAVIMELFLAGSETTSTTLRWSIIMMVNFPEVQEKINKEIDDVIGSNRLPSMKDRPAMPYTEATLLEVHRFSSIAALGVPHATTDDVRLQGYDIPKGTQVLSNIYSAHFDPEVFTDPHVFNPKRFLDAEGKVDNREMVISFSMGKRVCLGESLARMELFLFFTSILQRYTITMPTGKPLPPLDGIFNGFVRAPHDCDVIFKPRS